jgi:hypothetical protein
MCVVHEDAYSTVSLVFADDDLKLVSITMAGRANESQWTALRNALVALYARLSMEDHAFRILCDLTAVDLTLSQLGSMIVLLHELRPILRRLNRGTRLLMSQTSKRFVELLLAFYRPESPLEIVKS